MNFRTRRLIGSRSRNVSKSCRAFVRRRPFSSVPVADAERTALFTRARGRRVLTVRCLSGRFTVRTVELLSVRDGNWLREQSPFRPTVRSRDERQTNGVSRANPSDRTPVPGPGTSGLGGRGRSPGPQESNAVRVKAAVVVGPIAKPRVRACLFVFDNACGCSSSTEKSGKRQRKQKPGFTYYLSHARTRRERSRDARTPRTHTRSRRTPVRK